VPVGAPEAIRPDRDVGAFECTHADLVDFLRRRALANQLSGASRTWVACVDGRVVGYHSLAAGSVARIQVPGHVRRNMPEPIPAVVLGRLAVDARHEGQGIGGGLLKDAVLRSVNVAREVGARVLLCHAIDEPARTFYLHHGFRVSPIEELTVMLDLTKVAGLAGA
jgi:predicted N-acetyltransferase YhbS